MQRRINGTTVARVARRSAVGVLLVGAALLLSACTARGGGQIGEPLSGEPVAVYSGQATFGFTFTCELKGGKAVIRGQLEYHDKAPSTVRGVGFPAIALHGVVDPLFTDVTTCEAAAKVYLDVAQFRGTYSPQTLDPAIPDDLERGRFVVLVFDQGEPGGSTANTTGDAFSIELIGGRYTGYTRGGYIEGGNVQVDP